jgi:hypothetical protein
MTKFGYKKKTPHGNGGQFLYETFVDGGWSSEVRHPEPGGHDTVQIRDSFRPPIYTSLGMDALKRIAEEVSQGRRVNLVRTSSSFF